MSAVGFGDPCLSERFLYRAEGDLTARFEQKNIVEDVRDGLQIMMTGNEEAAFLGEVAEEVGERVLGR